MPFRSGIPMVRPRGDRQPRQHRLVAGGRSHPEEDLIPELLTDPLHRSAILCLLERDHVGIDRLQELGDLGPATTAPQQDVVGGDPHRRRGGRLGRRDPPDKRRTHPLDSRLPHRRSNRPESRARCPAISARPAGCSKRPLLLLPATARSAKTSASSWAGRDSVGPPSPRCREAIETTWPSWSPSSSSSTIGRRSASASGPSWCGRRKATSSGTASATWTLPRRPP